MEKLRYREQALFALPGSRAARRMIKLTPIPGDEFSFLQRLQQIHQELGIPPGFIDACSMPLCQEPPELVHTEPDYLARPQRLTPAALTAWHNMKSAAILDGVTLFLVSAFRSIEYQQQLIAGKLAVGQRIELILKVNAAPGFSEHHTGRAIDLGTPGSAVLEEEFELTPAFAWLSLRAGEFGFSLSYPRDNAMGIDYEPWHWCYHP